jgi:hypothetical protein
VINLDRLGPEDLAYAARQAAALATRCERRQVALMWAQLAGHLANVARTTGDTTQPRGSAQHRGKG